MKNWCVFLTACLLCGCFGDSKPRQPNDLQIAAQAEWAYAVSQLGIEQADPPSAETDRPPLGVPGEGLQSSRPVICVYAPAWSSDSQEFLEWYETSADVRESLRFDLELVPDDQIPDVHVDQWPVFTYGKKGTFGWTDIETVEAELLGGSDGTP